MTALLEGLKALGPARLVAMGGVALGVLALMALLGLRGGAPMALLYGDLELREAGQIAEQLERAHIAHQLEAQGTRILVPSTEIDRARLLLAKEGLPSGGSIGYEIFDRGDGLTASQFQQSINQTRALEGELARTIRMIQGVRAARVHLVLPRREPFARERQDAQASVVLTMNGAQRLDSEGTQAVLNLIAAAVPGLRPQNIAIVDSRGNLLARAGEPVGAAGTAQTTEELRRATEIRLSRAVEEMLERSLGPGRVRAEARVEMDFDEVHETQERFDPDGQVVRSQQSVNTSSKSTEAAPSVSVQNNLPNADAAGSGAGSQEGRQEETTNYEIGKTVRTLVREQPQIRRISLAVLVDGEATHNPDGSTGWKERSADEIARINTLVRSAIGFDEKRGDKVDVVNMRFAVDDAPPAPEKRFLGLPLEKADVLRLVETLMLGGIAVLALLLVLRPMAQRLIAPAQAAEAAGGEAGAALAGIAAAGGGAGAALPGAAALGALPAPGGAEEEDAMVNVSKIEGQMRASSLRKLTELVDKHPEAALSIVRGWMTQEAN